MISPNATKPIFHRTSPPSKDAPHAPAPKEKFKPKLRLPDKDSEFYKIPEEVGDRAGEGRPHGEGDHGLRAVAEENDHKVGDQKQGSDKEISANNHDPSSGLKCTPMNWLSDHATAFS